MNKQNSSLGLMILAIGLAVILFYELRALSFATGLIIGVLGGAAAGVIAWYIRNRTSKPVVTDRTLQKVVQLLFLAILVIRLWSWYQAQLHSCCDCSRVAGYGRPNVD